MTKRDQLVAQVNRLKPLALASAYHQRQYRAARRALKAYDSNAR